MAIAYIPNDPLARDGPPNRTVSPGRFPPRAASFRVVPAAALGTYAPLTPEFDFWQATTALQAGLRAWREADGRHLPRWQGNLTQLVVHTNAGDDLNAFYDRASLQFFARTYGGQTVHSVESVDVVTHELGHALLDAIRPDFWDVPFIEVAALHEAFGDCIALLTALEDGEIRAAVLAASPDLSITQFVESVAEQLGDALVREYGPGAVEAGALRHALNTLTWADPSTLPVNPPPNQLGSEPHSFSRVFTGAFYDLIRHLLTQGGAPTSASLRRAARTAGGLLSKAIRTVPASPTVFAGVGERMLQADIANNGGVHTSAIRSAFSGHGIELATPSTSLPEPLPGPARRRTRGLNQLRDRLEAPPGTRVEITPVESDIHPELAHVAAYRSIRLAGPGLEGTHIRVPGVARVTMRGRSIGGVVGPVVPSTDEGERTHAAAFARMLVDAGQLAGPTPAARRRMRGPTQPPTSRRPTATHEVRLVGGEPTIVRRGFSISD